MHTNTYRHIHKATYIISHFYLDLISLPPSLNPSLPSFLSLSFDASKRKRSVVNLLIFLLLWFCKFLLAFLIIFSYILWCYFIWSMITSDYYISLILILIIQIWKRVKSFWACTMYGRSWARYFKWILLLNT